MGAGRIRPEPTRGRRRECMFRRPLPSWRLLVGAIQGCPRTCPVVGPQAKSPAMSQAWQSPDCQVSKPVLRPPSQFHLLISQEEETAHLCHLQPSFRLGTPLPLSLPSSFHPTEVLLIRACRGEPASLSLSSCQRGQLRITTPKIVLGMI